MSKPIKVLICDDSAVIRAALKELLSNEPDIEVVGMAVNPIDARDKIKALQPDVLTLDIEMPEMDGLTFLQKIMALRPMPVIMCSSHTQEGSDATIGALEMGAVDCIGKPRDMLNPDVRRALKYELTSKVRHAAMAKLKARPAATPSSAATRSPTLSFKPTARAQTKIIAIGSSTGGVEALRDVLLPLPNNLPPIVVVQHMPEKFTASLAQRLDGIIAPTVVEATDGMKLQQGHVYIAPGGNLHMKVIRKMGESVCSLVPGPAVNNHSPSVDVLFDSVAELKGGLTVSVLLTGMGRDGAQGMANLRKAGGHTIGQDEATCVVYGMPRAAKNLNAVVEELPLPKISQAILDALLL